MLEILRAEALHQNAMYKYDCYKLEKVAVSIKYECGNKTMMVSI